MKCFSKILPSILLFLLINMGTSRAQSFNHNWAINLGNLGPGSALVKGSCTDSQNHYYAVGTLSGTVDAMPGSGYFYINSGVNNASKSFFAEYDSSGAMVRSLIFGGTGGKTTLSAIAVEDNGDILLAGNFKDSSFFEPNQPSMVYYSSGSSADGDLFLARYDHNFNLLWIKTFVNTQTFILQKIETDANGNIFTSGNFNNSVDIDPSAGIHNLHSYPANNSYKDIFLAQFSSNGTLNWAKSIGSSVDDELADISVDGNNNVVIGISFEGSSTYIDSVFQYNSLSADYIGIYQFSNSGNLNWQFNNYSNTSGGYIKIFDLKCNNAGEVFFTGSLGGSAYFLYPAILGACGSSVICEYLAKLNSSGVCTRAETAYGSSCVGRTLDLDAVSNVYLGGYFTGTKDFDYSTAVVNLTSTPSTGSNYFISSYDSTGSFRWANKIPTSGIPDLRLSNSEKIWMEGEYTGTVDFDPGTGTNSITVPSNTNFVSTFSSHGSYQNAFAFKGCGSTKDVSTAVSKTINNGVIVAGVFTGEIDLDPGTGASVLTAVGDSSAYLAAYTEAGALSWAKLISGYALVKGIATNDSGYVFITGYFTGQVDFDPLGPAGTLYGNTGFNDIFMAKFDPLGALLWVHKFSSAYDDEGHDINVDANGNIIMTGIFNTLIDFDPSTTGTFNLTTPQSTTNGYVAKYDSNGNFLMAFKMPGTISNQVETDNNNNIIVNGTMKSFGNFNTSGSNGIVYTTGGSNDEDYYIAKYDEQGNYLFAFKIGSLFDDVAGSDIRIDNAGNIFFAGFVSGSGDTIDLDPSPANYPVLGYSGVLAKFTPAGTLEWGFSAGFRAPLGLGLDANGNATVAGSYYGTEDVDPGPGTSILGGPVNSMVMLRYSSMGQYLNGSVYSAGIKVFTTELEVTDSNKVYTSGQFAGNIDFDLAPGNQNLFLNNGTTAQTNGFLLSLTQSNYLAQTPPFAAFNVSANTGCEGLCVNFNDNSLFAPNSWNWSFPGGNPSTSTLQNPGGICYANPGQYNVQLIVSNSLGNDTLLMPDYISVYAVPQVNAGNDISICEGSSVQLNGSGASTYSWSPASSLTGAATANPVATPAVTTTYTLAGANGSCEVIDEVTVTVNPNPPTPGISMVSGELQSSAAFAYQWFYNGFPISGATFQNYFPSQTGNYSVMVYDSLGCYSNSAPYTVTVVGLNHSSMENSAYFLQPNPVIDAAVLSTETEKNNVLIRLTDVSGRRVAEQWINLKKGNNDLPFEFSKLRAGLYYLEIRDAQDFSTIKLLKAN